MKITNFKKRKIKLLTKEQQEPNENRYAKDKKLGKVTDCCHYTGEYSGAAHNICNLKYSVPKKFLQFSIMDQTILSFYHKTVSRKI